MPQDTVATTSATGAIQEKPQSMDFGKLLQDVLGSITKGGAPLTSNQTTPGSYIPPVQKQTAPQQIGGGQEFRSRGAANYTAASNLFGNIASSINTARQNADAQKSRKLAIDVERVYTAQAGITQAEQQLKQNPNDANAKQMLEHNKQLINDMLADPKRRKELEKAFDYTFVGEDKNANSWERKAAKMGAKSYQEQLAKQMPQTEQPNQSAIAQQKAQVDTIKAMGPIISAAIRAQATQNKTDQTAATEAAKLQERATEAFNKHKDYQDRTGAMKQLYAAEYKKADAAVKMLEHKIGQDGINNILKANKNAGDAIASDVRDTTSRINNLSGKGKLTPEETNELQMLTSRLQTLRQRQVTNSAKQDAYSYVTSGKDPSKEAAVGSETLGVKITRGGTSGDNKPNTGTNTSDDELEDDELINDSSTQD